MRRSKNINMGAVLWIIIILVTGNIGAFSRMFSPGDDPQPVTEDMYMTTGSYHTDIEVNTDNSYSVKESIHVTFDSPRHGIYRYIPYKGTITQSGQNGELDNIPYYARIDDVNASVYLDVSSDNGNKVLRLGDEDQTAMGRQDYELSYRAAPVTSKGYGNVYWNIYPSGWRNEIPAGSTFQVKFPGEFDHGQLALYYGQYGEQLNALDITDISWEGDTLYGSLREPLPVGCGMTVYVPMESGYFTDVKTVAGLNIGLIIASAVIGVIVLLLFLLFGRDEPIIPSVQFKPPQGLDSASVGYIIDGNVSDTDLVSLFIFWADRGYIKIRETENKSLAFTKLMPLPDDAPGHARALFDAVFGNGPDSISREVLVSDMKYCLADTFQQVRALLKKEYRDLYTRGSKTARAVSYVLSVIPVLLLAIVLMTVTHANAAVMVFAALYFAGILLFGRTVDFWYSRARTRQRIWGSVSTAFGTVPFLILILMYGVRMLRGQELNLFPALACVSVLSVVLMILTGFMKKRTAKCVEWMGYLTGLRDFIETAELERMKAIAEDDPQLFYRVLPFAYVFGLSDVLLDRMKDLMLPAPQWYETRSQSPYFDYYLMHYMLHTDMSRVAQTISTPAPPPSADAGGSGSFGGGFTGGGFSGGGFGGGGGGSW